MSSVSDRLDDFPDRISPMLVKELRQGMRAKSFVMVFLVMQALLGLILLAATVSVDSADSGQTISKIVFVLYSFVVLIIQPLRGISSLSSEVRGDTIDLMVLTRLSSMRIVIGKWIAIVAQSALMASTIIPYLILRYYFGNMNLFAELMLVVMIFIFSMGLTAVTVGVSGCKLVLVRGILPIFGAVAISWWILYIGFSRDFDGLIDLFTFDRSDDVSSTLLIIVVVAYLGWSALSMGASLIAPHAENHSTLRRVIALVVTAIALVACKANHANADLIPVIWFIFAAPAIGIALAEPNYLIPSVYRAFTRRGALGKVAGRFLYPGWPSAVLFTFLLIGLGALFVEFSPKLTASDSPAVTFTSLSGSLLFVGLILIWSGKRITDRTSSFILLWLGSLIFTFAIFSTMSAVSNRSFLWAFIWNPIMLLPMMGYPSFNKNDLFLAGSVVNIAYASALLVMAVMAFRSIRTLEDKTTEE